MDNISALGAARRRWWLILLMAGLGAALGALPSPAKVEQQAIRYTAIHTMLLNDSDSQSGSSGVSPNQVSFFAVTGEVPKRVAASIGYAGSPAELASQVTVEFDTGVGALRVTTTQDSATQAETVANTFAEELNKYLAERQDAYTADRLAASNTRLATLEGQLDDLATQQAASPGDNVIAAKIDAIRRQYSVAFEQNQALSEATTALAFTTLERAQAIPEAPEGLQAPTSRLTRGVMGLLVGGALGLGIAMLASIFDRRIRTREQAEEMLGIRARALVPSTVEASRGAFVVARNRHDPLSDSYRTVRNVVSFVHDGLPTVNRGRITVVVSAGPSEGKTSLVANLSAAFAETGRRTIAVNTDFRRPRLTRVITGDVMPVQPYNLDDTQRLDPNLLLAKTHDPGLSILDLSKLGSAGELARTTARLVPILARSADSVVIDTSPVGATAEVLDLLAVADAIVMVVRLGATRADAAIRTLEIIRDITEAPVLLVITGAKQGASSYYEYPERRRSDHSQSGRQARRTLRHPFRKVYKGPERRRMGRDVAAPAEPTTERRLPKLHDESIERRERQPEQVE